MCSLAMNKVFTYLLTCLLTFCVPLTPRCPTFRLCGPLVFLNDPISGDNSTFVGLSISFVLCNYLRLIDGFPWSVFSPHLTVSYPFRFRVLSTLNFLMFPTVTEKVKTRFIPGPPSPDDERIV